MLLLLSSASTGQLIQYDPKTKTSKTLINSSSGKLRVANGVAVSKDNKYVYVQGMMDGAIGRYSIENGQIDDLHWAPIAGFPDNLVTRSEGLYGAIVIQHSFLTKILFHSTWGRNIIPRLPELPLGADDPCLIFHIPTDASSPVKYLEIHDIPACNCAVPHNDGYIYTSSYLLDGAIARFKNPFVSEEKIVIA
jgi:hypothetical protein